MGCGRFLQVGEDSPRRDEQAGHCEEGARRVVQEARAYTELLCSDTDVDDSGAVLGVSILAGALVAGTDRAVIHWFEHPEERLVGLTQAVLDTIEPLSASIQQ